MPSCRLQDFCLFAAGSDCALGAGAWMHAYWFVLGTVLFKISIASWGLEISALSVDLSFSTCKDKN